VRIEARVHRVPVLVGVRLSALDVADRHRHYAVRDVVLADFIDVRSGYARETDELPSGFVAIASVQRIGEEPLVRVGPQHREVQRRRHGSEPHRPRFQAREYRRAASRSSKVSPCSARHCRSVSAIAAR